ncbi:MAG: acyl-CoA dehydratase activase-related protein [Bacillota bacterium]
MTAKIGIPRALAYYAYYPLWKKFFEELGFEVVTSRITTKGILDSGIREAVTDACVPIKLFHGHVLDLRDRVDYLFIPRLVSVNKEAMVTFCPKFLGLPDMIKASLSGLPPIIDVRVDLKKGNCALFKVCREIGKSLDKGFWAVSRAYRKAWQVHRRYLDLLTRQKTPEEALALLEGVTSPVKPEGNTDLKFAILGFPYTIYDRFVNVDLLERLRRLGVQVFTTEMVPSRELLQQAKKMPKNLFWNFSNQVIRAALYYLDHKPVDGIIHITAFGCGPDAMADKIIELEARQRGKVPFLSITIDEHTGEAGLITRLEAFVDMLRFRRELT